MTITPNKRSTVQGRPKSEGRCLCTRCGRSCVKFRVKWTDERLCNSCFYTAMRTRGICPDCGHDGLLPGRREHSRRADDDPVCLICGNIWDDYTCRVCGKEGELIRNKACARCVVREDLTPLLLPRGCPAKAEMRKLLDVFCAAARPESIRTWMRSEQVKNLLIGLGSGRVPLSQEGLDSEDPGRHVEHLRSLLEHHGLIPQQDAHLARFERWIADKLVAITEPTIRQPVEQFATWHHLRRVRLLAAGGKSTQGPVHTSKQEITETIKFLTWLHAEHGRAAAHCLQTDVEQWLGAGPTTRHAIRNFFLWARKNRVNKTVAIERRQARTVRILTQEQRLAWIKELLTGDSESLAYRVAGMLLLLYAQPLTKIVALRTTDLVATPADMMINLGTEPSPVPQPFADLLKQHLANRPNLRAGNHGESPWLFPSPTAGQHIHRNMLMDRLRQLGIDLLAARNSTMRALVTQAPPPLVAELLGYSYQIAQRHADLAAQPWQQYSSLLNRPDGPRREV